MTREDIFTICQDHCCEHFGIPKEDCHEDASFYDDFEADDLDRIELAMFVEERFDVDFIDEEINYFEINFGQFISKVEEKINSYT